MAEEFKTRISNMNDVDAYWQVHGPLGGHNCIRRGVDHLGGKCSIIEMLGLKRVILVAKATE
jgi:hypothetical protein